MAVDGFLESHATEMVFRTHFVAVLRGKTFEKSDLVGSMPVPPVSWIYVSKIPPQVANSMAVFLEIR